MQNSPQPRYEVLLGNDVVARFEDLTDAKRYFRELLEKAPTQSVRIRLLPTSQ